MSKAYCKLFHQWKNIRRKCCWMAHIWGSSIIITIAKTENSFFFFFLSRCCCCCCCSTRRNRRRRFKGPWRNSPSIAKKSAITRKKNIFSILLLLLLKKFKRGLECGSHIVPHGKIDYEWMEKEEMKHYAITKYSFHRRKEKKIFFCHSSKDSLR